MSKLKQDDVQNYQMVINDNLTSVYMNGKMGQKLYLGMSLENLAINIINLLEDCDNNVDDFKKSVKDVFRKVSE